MSVPPELGRLGSSSEGRAWLDSLPRLVDAAVRRWSLTLGEPLTPGSGSYVVAATTPPGTEVVLKLAFPHRESRYEAAALARWAGDGAARLVDHDETDHALLLEPCVPGTPLSEEPSGRALGVLTDLLDRHLVPAGEPFGTLTDEAAWWASYLPERWQRAGRRFPEPLLDEAMRALEELPPTQGEIVLVNQDLHAGNVLAAQREAWLLIDPKPLAGERAFGVASLVRGRELGHGRAEVLQRLDRLSDALALDRDRARRWALAQTLAWSFDHDRVHADHVEVARWLSSEGP